VTLEVCAPIPAATVQEALNLLRKAEEKHADLIEFRLDYLENSSGIRELASRTRLLRIATNRRTGEGGRFRGREPDRVRALLEAAGVGCEFVDIELATDNVRDIVKKAKRLGAKVIVSYHDFQSTPNLQKLNMILKKQVNVGADICKIVSTANAFEDNLRILEFVSNSNRRGKVVSFAMGKLGVISRILCPVYGAPFTYASVERGAESAPGQLTLDEIRDIYRLMGLE